MNSLRVRLILGFSLVAVLPLAIGMVLLSQRIQTTVREQAAERLDAALGIIRGELRADGEEIETKLGILGNDPLLKRLYLLRPAEGRDLSDYLAEQRFLLGLDFLLVADTSGALIADGSTAAAAPGRSDRYAGRVGPTHASFGLALESLDGTAGMALAATAPILYRGRAVAALRGGMVLDDSVLSRLKQTSGVDLALQDAVGRTVATTLENRAGSSLPSSPRADRAQIGGRSYLIRSAVLETGPAPHASIVGLASTASADQTIAALQKTSALLGLVGVALAIGWGVVWSLQVSRPVERLAGFSERIAQGHWDEPLAVDSVRELQTLVSALDRMRGDLIEYRERLLASERQAAWSQMARMVAHEIRNPLTPIAVSVSDLQRSFEQKRADFPEILEQAVRTIGDEVQTLKRLLEEFSEFGRLPAPSFAPCRLSELLADVGTLHGREIADGRLSLPEPREEVSFQADRAQIRQALVNLVKNGLEAAGVEGRVRIATRRAGRRLEIAVSDTGPGLGPQEKARLFVPEFTTKARGSGLGLTIVQRIVHDHGGEIAVESAPGRGATFRIRLPFRQEAVPCHPYSSSTTKPTS